MRLHRLTTTATGWRSTARGAHLGAVALAGCAIALAACGSTSASGGSSAAYTVSAQSIGGVGTVLVNGDGHTLYMLSSEQGGKLTCTDANGCTKVWPDTELPSGVTHGVAGSGVQASLLGTVKSSDGSLYLTYGGWPLYTYSGDSGPAQIQGEGIVSYGGTWYVLGTDGQPVKSVQPSTSSRY